MAMECGAIQAEVWSEGFKAFAVRKQKSDSAHVTVVVAPLNQRYAIFVFCCGWIALG
jgi:hypothetical protein